MNNPVRKHPVIATITALVATLLTSLLLQRSLDDFVDDLDLVRRLEDAGAAAIVMRSLFEEQLAMEQMATVGHVDTHEGAHAEAASFLPSLDTFRLGPEDYAKAKASVVSLVPDLAGVTFLDVGCGSGLFSIAASASLLKPRSFLP